MTRVYVPDVADGAARVEVSDDEAHHLVRVLRVRAGDTVGVFDGRGREWRARVDGIGRGSVTLVIEGTASPVVEPPVHVTLAVGILKGDQMDDVVRDATVMGVTTIRPVVTDHVVVSPRAWRDDRGLDRWHRVAVAAAKQCGRAVVPTITPVAPLPDLWPGPGMVATAAMTLVCVEPAATGGISDWSTRDWRTLTRPSSAVLCIGPEGGWSPAELAAFAERQACAVSLGPRTLRAEAAPAVALTLLWATWGWTHGCRRS